MSIIDQITQTFLTKSRPFILSLTAEQVIKGGCGDERLQDNNQSLISVVYERPLKFSAESEVTDIDVDVLKKTFIELFPPGFLKEEYVAIVLPDNAFAHGIFSVPSIALKTGFQPLLEREVHKNSELTFNDYIVRYEVGSKSGNLVNVSYCALPKTSFNKIAETCEASGLVPISIQPAFTGTVKLINNSIDDPHPLVFIDLGLEALSAGVIHEKILQQFQLISSGFSPIISRLSEDLNLPLAEAKERLLNEIILLEDPSSDAQLEVPEYTIIESLLAELLQKIYGFLLLYSNDHPEQNGFSQIVLTGEGCKIKNIDKLIAENLGITTNYLSKTASDKLPPLTGEIAIEQAASGLGMALLKPWQTEKFERIFAA